VGEVERETATRGDGVSEETANERANRYERWLLAAILLEPKRLGQVTCKREHFLTTGHGDIFQAMCNLSESKQVMDIAGIADEAASISKNNIQFIYVCSLYDEVGIVPENIAKYDREVTAAHRRREFHKCHEAIGLAETRAEQMKLLDTMRDLLMAK